jgi:hypothetical protein
METKKAIARHQESIEFDQEQIEYYTKRLLEAERDLKVWRVYKMVDELFLWFEMKGNFTLYDKQYNRLKGIQNKLKEQYEQQN